MNRLCPAHHLRTSRLNARRARKLQPPVWILGGIGLLLVCATLTVGFFAVRAEKNAGFAFRFDPAKKTLVLIGADGNEVKTSAIGDGGHALDAADQKVLVTRLAQHPEYRAAVDADCACDEALRSNPGAHSYTAAGDFNQDGKQDFAGHGDPQENPKVRASHFQWADRRHSTGTIRQRPGSSTAGPVFRSVPRGASASLPWLLRMMDLLEFHPRRRAMRRLVLFLYAWLLFASLVSPTTVFAAEHHKVSLKLQSESWREAENHKPYDLEPDLRSSLKASGIDIVDEMQEARRLVSDRLQGKEGKSYGAIVNPGKTVDFGTVISLELTMISPVGKTLLEVQASCSTPFSVGGTSLYQAALDELKSEPLYKKVGRGS